MKTHPRTFDLPRALAAVFVSVFLIQAAAHAGFWDKVKSVSDSIKKGKETVETADRVQQKTARVIKGVRGFPLEQEIALGDSVAMEITGRSGGVWQDEAATLRVNLIGKTLARYCDRQELQWVFGVLDSDVPNAFSAPGGRVFITRGLYQLARDDDEIAGILGHEITHITRRHALSSLQRGELLAASLDLAGEINGDSAAYNEDINTILGTLFDHGLDPSAEYEADSGAVKLCELAGFDRGGLRASLQAISKQPKDGTWKPSDVFSTHPPLATRVAKLPKRTTEPRPSVMVASTGAGPETRPVAVAEAPKPVFPKLPGARPPAAAAPAPAAHEHAVPPGSKFCPECGAKVN